MLNKRSEKGQAIVIIIFAIIGLLGLTGLAVDGGMAFSDRRQAQGAADSAAWAAALTKANKANITQVEADALAIADQNGFPENSTHSVVTVTFKDLPVAPLKLSDGKENPCPIGATPNVEITVQITSHVKTFFAPIIGVQQVTNKVEAATLSCGEYTGALFNGNAIVSLNPSTDPGNCPFNSSTGSATWNVTGSGIASNGCAAGITGNSNNANNVNLNGHCVSAVGNATFGSSAPTCSGSVSTYNQTYIDSIMPPNPCDGTPGDVGIVPPAPPRNGTVTLSNGVYCISDFDAYSGLDIQLNAATLYVTDPEFDLRFSGGGGFTGTPGNIAPYVNYYLIVKPSANLCTKFNDQNAQTILFRGNGVGSSQGTILAPGACLDIRGNGSSAINGQVVGYSVSANGTGDGTINYVQNQNPIVPTTATVQLVK